MRLFGITLLLLCSIGLSSAMAQVVSRIAAVVNKDIITTYQLDLKLQEQLAKQERKPSPAQLGALRQEMLSRMIEETLVQQRIKALNLNVSEEEIETALLDVQQKNKMTREALEDAVTSQGLDLEDYRDNLKKQILRYKLISEEVANANRGLAPVGNVRKFHILTKELDHDDDEVTATMKIRRSKIYEGYKQEIAAMY